MAQKERLDALNTKQKTKLYAENSFFEKKKNYNQISTKE